MTSQIGHLSRGVVVNPDRTWGEYRALIEKAIVTSPRDLQTRIGPSGLGTPCDRCLAHMLAETPEDRDPSSQWLPTVGKGVHAWLAEAFIAANAGLPAGAIRYLVEQEVSVGVIATREITGNADLFDLWTGEVTDWKIVSDTTIKNVKANGPGDQYRAQAHLYGRGYTRRGCTVNCVRVAFLPRNHASLSAGHIWSEPYDEQVATDALTRADRIALDIWEHGLNVVLDSLPPHVGGHQCRRFPGAPVSASGLSGLICEPTA